MRRVSRCREEDAALLAALEKECFDDPWEEKNILFDLKENPFAVLLRLDDEDGLAGYIDYMVTFDSATISRLAVTPNKRRKGYGKALLAAMEKELKGLEEPPSFSTLEVATGNTGAVALYQSAGYAIVAKKEGYYSNGGDAYYMVKGL